MGQVLSSIIGVGICKLFALSDQFEALRWLAAALACASATAVMVLTGTVHPPAGATALIAVVDSSAVKLGWYLVPLVILSCVLMLSVALLLNNIQRRFPVYWWSPEDTGGYWLKPEPVERQTKEDEKASDVESAHNAHIHIEEVDNAQQILIVQGAVYVPRDMYLRHEEKQMLESLCQRL